MQSIFWLMPTRSESQWHRLTPWRHNALLRQILETSDRIDPDTLALSNQPRGGENLVAGITGDLKTLGIK